MATSNLNFSQQVNDWVRRTEGRLNAVFRGSTQEIVSRILARIPIDTGFARASVRASLSTMPPINSAARPARGRNGEEERGSVYPYDPGNIILVINGAVAGDTIYIGWTAAYVIFLEYGSSMQAPMGFVGITAQEWPRIVEQITAQAQARAGQ